MLEETNMRHFFHLIAVSVSLLIMSLPAVAGSRPAIDVVIAMDVSGSMSGLIDSAKQRLWDVVNTFSRAHPQPELRVAIVSFGAPNYGINSGYVRIDQPLATDLDSVNETLFAFTTNGSDEYVARAIATSINQLDWSQSPNAMRVIFVAGNESAEQDPAFALEDVLARAVDMGIIVNAIYCGSENGSIAASWRQLALQTQGTFAAIDQSANVVAQIETPVDAQLAELSKELNKIYIPYGEIGQAGKERQVKQDDIAREMSLGALASRTITKASALYKSVQWDLVDAFEQGQPLSEIAPEMLPEPMQNMPLDEIEQLVEAQSQRRDELKKEIAELDAKRRNYVEEYRSTNGAAGLGAALSDALTAQAEEHGFVVD
jgi:hypothetical protein